MKQVTGMLRLDLAYYGELQAFAQFATELDRTTRSQLARGERMMELLKQPQYRPMPMAEQVVVIYAGTHGYVDGMEVDEVAEFAGRLVTFVRERHPRMLQTIRESGELSEETEKELQQAIEDCRARDGSQGSGQAEEGGAQ
jgi:F-type H+-transporting ATPase subunit alpha